MNYSLFTLIHQFPLTLHFSDMAEDIKHSAENTLMENSTEHGVEEKKEEWLDILGSGQIKKKVRHMQFRGFILKNSLFVHVM